MGRVLTNATNINMVKQAAFRNYDTAALQWIEQERNELPTFGSDFAKVARDPVSKDRQDRAASLVDENAALEIETDLTLQVIEDYFPSFMFVQPKNFDTVFRGAGVATADQVTTPIQTAEQGAKFIAGTLWSLKGYTAAAGNGLFPLAVTATLAGGDTVLDFAGAGVPLELAPPSFADVSLAGYRAAAGDLTVVVTGTDVVVTSALNVDFSLWLTPGQTVHFGGLTDAERPGQSGTRKSFGSFTVLTAGPGTITGRNGGDTAEDGAGVYQTLVSSDGTDDNLGGTAVAVDLLFGRFMKNVAVDDVDFREDYFLAEGSYPGLFQPEGVAPVVSPDGFEYVRDLLPNQLALSLPLTDKAGVTIGFVGTKTENFVDDTGRKANASGAVSALRAEPFNTAQNCSRLRITDVDETGLTTDFKDTTVTLTNNVSGEKVLCFLGSKYLNYGNMQVSIDSTIVFNDARVIDRIKSNATVQFSSIVANSDGAVVIDIPAMKLGGGAREFTRNESVKASLTGNAFKDPTFGASMMVSLFPVYPAALVV